MKKACLICKQVGLTLDRESLCHRCWQDRLESEAIELETQRMIEESQGLR